MFKYVKLLEFAMSQLSTHHSTGRHHSTGVERGNVVDCFCLRTTGGATSVKSQRGRGSAVSKLNYMYVRGFECFCSPLSPEWLHSVRDCATGENKTLNLLYANVKESYIYSALPPLDRMAECTADYFCIDTATPTRTAHCSPNNKPQMTRNIKTQLKENKEAFRDGERERLRCAT